MEVIDKDPEELGYEFGRWTAQRLATYLERLATYLERLATYLEGETGIKLSGSQIRRILKSKKYVYIWAKYSLEESQDPEKRKLFKEKFYEYLKIAKESPESL